MAGAAAPTVRIAPSAAPMTRLRVSMFVTPQNCCSAHRTDKRSGWLTAVSKIGGKTPAIWRTMYVRREDGGCGKKGTPVSPARHRARGEYHQPGSGSHWRECERIYPVERGRAR